MLELKTEAFIKEVEEHDGLVVIDLYANWCNPCRMLAPILAKLEEEHPEVKFCKINVDEEPQLAAQFHVQSIPMVAFVKDNTFLDMSVGLVPKSEIEKMINEYK
jgi:thioredoxin 1